MALPTDLDTLLARVDALRDEIAAMRPLDPDDAGRAMQRLRLEWTYHSNAIEGNSLTYGETRALLMHGVTAHGKPLKDHLDIRRHREVIEYLEAFVGSDEPLTLAVLREMHKMLMGDTYEVTAETPDGERVKRTVEGGAFKTLPNNVVTETGEMHYYASPEETPARMTDLLDDLREVGEDVHPVVRAALFHHRFVEIHPFPDGNGRTARVLTNLLLMRAGYVPAVIRQDQRPAYYGALSEADDGGDTQPIIQFVAEELAETMELYLRALRGEPDPTAFDRRLALLRREADRPAAETEITEAERVRFSRDLFLPLFREGERRAAELASLFGEMNLTLGIVGSEGKQVFHDNARVLLGAGDVVSLHLSWRFHGLRRDPALSATCFCQGRFGDSAFAAKCHPSQQVFEFKAGQPLGAVEVMAMADALFDPVMDAVEKAVRQ